MSSQQPDSKRQKRSGHDEAAPEPIAFGGPMYDEATARKMLEEVEDVVAKYVGNGELESGFDPDDAELDNVYWLDDDTGGYVTPMMYFADKCDEKMCGYLISRGASTTKVAGGCTPMHAAAHGGHLQVCKLLQANGAGDDIRRESPDGLTPFHEAIGNGHDELARWLVLEGALCADANSEEVQGDRIPRMLHPEDARACERLVEWAKEVTQSHSALVSFLLGTLPRAPDKAKDQNFTLQYLSGHRGVRKHIGDFVGLEVTKAKQFRILRSVVEVLPSYFEFD